MHTSPFPRKPNFRISPAIDSSTLRHVDMLSLYDRWFSGGIDASELVLDPTSPAAETWQANAVLLERHEDDFIYRVLGSHTGELSEWPPVLGGGLDHLPPDYAAFLRELYDTSLNENRPLHVVHRDEVNRAVYSWERLILPLCGATGGSPMVLVYRRPQMMRHELLETVLASSHSGIMALESVRGTDDEITDFTIIKVNHVAERIFRRNAETMIDHSFLSVFPNTAHNGLFAAYVAVADGGEPLDTVHSQRARGIDGEVLKDGEFRYYRITAMPSAAGVTVTFSDITDLTQSNQALEQSNQRLAQTNRQLAREIGRRKTLEFELRQLATIDALTGLTNRRFFIEKAQSELVRAKREQAHVSLLYIDLDHFKSLNDRYGHAAGDEALRQTAALMKGTVRCSDTLARLGGEEFAVLMPRCRIGEAAQVAERLRARVENTSIVHETHRISLTLSIGISTRTPDKDDDLDRLIAQADRALYEAKRSGRNRVVQGTPQSVT